MPSLANRFIHLYAVGALILNRRHNSRMLRESCSANLTNSNLIATADPPILGIALLPRRGVNDQSDQVSTICPVHTISRERTPTASSGRQVRVLRLDDGANTFRFLSVI